MSNDDLIVGLDIGTTKICAIVAERGDSGILEITGLGVSPSHGMRRGVVINIESTLRSVVQAIEIAEQMSGREISNCWTSIGGASIESRISRGVVAVSGKSRDQREISELDIERVLDAARAVNFPMDREILEVIPQSFIVDSQQGIKNPLDMIGVRLESEVHIITCSMTSAQNIVRCVNRAGFRVDGLVMQSLAAASAVLTEEEKDLGVAVIDLGGGTTNVILFAQGAAYSTFSVPSGGSQVTNDISIVKNVSLESAEKIKVEAGCCWEPLIEHMEEEILVPGMGGRAPFSITRSSILEIIEPRMREIFERVKEKLEKSSQTKSLGGGIVLTGGGAKLLGAADLASRVFRLPVRIGEPLSLGGLAGDFRSPEYATAIGLIIEGDLRENQSGLADGEMRRREHKKESPISSFIRFIKKEFF